LVFPAWVAFGNWKARGVDAVGQRLIVVGGTTLLVALAAAPGALAGAVVWFAFNRLIGPIALVPAAVACAAVIGLEVLLTTEALGPAYEQLDITSVERAE
jgi:ABC-2 type transport system permease protein